MPNTPDNPQKLVILGNSWLAEEMYDLISEMPEWQVDAFAENLDPQRCKKKLEGLPVIWIDELARMSSTHLAVCGISTTHRGRYTQQAAGLGMSFAAIVHPTARVSARAELGEGCFISAGCVVSTRTVLGDHVFLNRGAMIGHHTRIGELATIQPGANIAGLVEIGERTYVGMGAVVLDRIKIGKGCVIGAGAVVTRDVPDCVQVVGVPAKIVKTDIEGK